jgi:hypothetical protein
MSEQTPPTPITQTAPPEIISLVERFTGQRAAYRSGRYNETQLRRDFLDPLFEALGWDMTNRKNYSEKYREVIHEVSVEIEGHAKAADYSFQSGGSIHFVTPGQPNCLSPLSPILNRWRCMTAAPNRCRATRCISGG